MSIHIAKVPASDLEGADWFTSSYSNGGGNCVEVAHGFPNAIPVRDSKDPEGPVLQFSAQGWSAFVSAIKRGDFA